MVRAPVLKICFGPPTAESKNLKNHVNFDVGDLFFRSPALWSSQNVFGPPTAGRVVVDFKDRADYMQPAIKVSISLRNLCYTESEECQRRNKNIPGLSKLFSRVWKEFTFW